MSIILGINSNHADSSACILVDGKLEVAIEEERINRKKHWAGSPKESINKCLEILNLKFTDITDIAINTKPNSNLIKKIPFFFRNYIFGKKKYEIIDRYKSRTFLKNSLLKDFKITKNKKIKFHKIEHHLAHIASAYFPSGYEKAIGLSIDGFGDFCSLAISECENSKIKIVKKIYFPHSLGVFYESMTQFLGFKNYGDEYKMMGLSSYGNPRYTDEILNKIFLKKKDFFELNLKYFNHHKKDYQYKFLGIPKQNTLYSEKFKEIFGDNENFNLDNISQNQKDIAASSQKVFEIILNQILKNNINFSFSNNLVYAGGCALNSLANGKILESKKFDNFFIPYAPGDAGGAIGASFCAFKSKFKKKPLTNIKSPFIGPRYSADYIDKVLNENKNESFSYEKLNNNKELNIIISNLLAEKKIIGWFQDKMEFGARALGNRSILADPREAGMKDILNEKIKKRESFRPFAPVILDYEKKNWFKLEKKNPYMSFVETIIPEKRIKIGAVSHIDGTGRVQTVSKDTNLNLFLLLESFFAKTGVPILINTSFNENEPIVLNPQQALDCFLRTKMDYLVLNNYLIKRK